MTDRRFPEVPGGYPFPRLEQETLARWQAEGLFRRTLEKTRGGEPFVFFEGPPTANNVPHVGHVLTRVVKDLFPRFRTMQGFHVERKAGWDTHGLAVEIEVEKSLGLSGKKDIEAIVPGDRRASIEAFNRKCLESVMTYEEKWRAMSERVGYWIDLDDAYFTYSNRYVESVWWSLAELHRKQLLFEGFKIQPYCARCGTTLSSHEVAQNYKEADDPSIWTIFKILPGQKAKSLLGKEEDLSSAGLVGWTTTPWTTIANVAVAVNPKLEYKLVEFAGQRLIIGNDLGSPLVVRHGTDPIVLTDLREMAPLAVFSGAALEGLRYQRLFEFYEPDYVGRVVLGDYVTAGDGTGLVHTAPPFGEDDYATGQRYGLPMILSVDADGKMGPGAGPFAGHWFKDADREILRDLRQRGLLLKDERYKHNYPFCWRCDQPLLYFANRNWFVRTTELRDRLVANNRTIDWHPAHIGEGRFGNWLENVVDWALSRKRYWGTPLPLWRCDADPAHVEVIGSFEELFAKQGKPLPTDRYDRGQFDPHRPYIDDVTWRCSCSPGCSGTMRRVDDVIDAWYDSGAMPFAQHHYPFENQERVAPGGTFRSADFIAEAVDQTRGWFYTLHVLASALFDDVAFRHCIVMGHVADDQGKKMSKRLGNVVEPMKVIEETGADALRWYFYVNDPEQASRFSARLVRESAQNFLMPLWNALSFFTIYANIDGWRPPQEKQKILGKEERPFLDRWIVGRLGAVAGAVTDSLDRYEIAPAARALEGFVDDVTNWYIRRSRDRFWSGAESVGKSSAYQTLYEVLTTLARLIAPFTPFVAEAIHQQLVGSSSVHLSPWPDLAAEFEIERLAMQRIQQVVELGRSARSASNIKTRQPLGSVTLVTQSPTLRADIEAHLAIVREELNVRDVHFAENRDEYARSEVRPNFRVLGKKVGKHMKAIQAALEASDPSVLTQQLSTTGSVTIHAAEQDFVLTEDDLEIRLVQKEGMATAGDRDLLVALDIQLTPELIAEGRAREVVNRIQTARKEANLEYTDRIRVRYRAAPEIEAAIDAHRTWIGEETLAVEIAAQKETGADLKPAPVDELEFAFSIEKAVPSSS